MNIKRGKSIVNFFPWLSFTTDSMLISSSLVNVNSSLCQRITIKQSRNNIVTLVATVSGIYKYSIWVQLEIFFFDLFSLLKMFMSLCVRKQTMWRSLYTLFFNAITAQMIVMNMTHIMLPNSTSLNPCMRHELFAYVLTATKLNLIVVVVLFLFSVFHVYSSSVCWLFTWWKHSSCIQQRRDKIQKAYFQSQILDETKTQV